MKGMDQHDALRQRKAAVRQQLLGRYVHVRVTRPLGAAMPDTAPDGERNYYELNYGELAGRPSLGGCARPEGVFIMGIHHPVRLFDGRVIAVVSAGGRAYAVAAPRKSRYIVGQIRKALRFAFPPEQYPPEELRLQCLYERSCGAVVFCGRDLRYLLIKNRRSSNWGFPKGHMENNETPEQTARREILEETGLRVRLLPGFSCHSEYIIRGSIEKSVTIFLAESPDTRTKIQEEEIADYMWATYHKALYTLKFENDRNTLRKAHAYLRRGGRV